MNSQKSRRWSERSALIDVGRVMHGPGARVAVSRFADISGRSLGRQTAIASAFGAGTALLTAVATTLTNVTAQVLENNLVMAVPIALVIGALMGASCYLIGRLAGLVFRRAISRSAEACGAGVAVALTGFAGTAFMMVIVSTAVVFVWIPVLAVIIGAAVTCFSLARRSSASNPARKS